MKNIKVIIMAICILIYVFIVISLMFIFPTPPKLNKLNFDIQIKENGDIQVVEDWDISFDNNSTLYKNFEIDKSKFSKITNVSVKEIDKNNINEYKKINEYMYHLKRNTYYALDLQNGWFEIAWGTEFSERKTRKNYQISYTIKDVITNYNDCSELYWQLLGENFNISAKKINGKISIPNGIDKEKDIRAWGHLQNLNGNIKVEDENTVLFKATKYEGNQPLEIRIIFPNNIVKTISNKTKKIEMADEILQEEEKYSKESNNIRLKNYLIIGIIVFILFVIAYYEMKIIIKYIRMIKENHKKILKPKIDYEYFRDIPSKNTSPGQATFLMYSKNEPTHGDFSNIFIATILSLVHKEYFEIKTVLNKNGKETVYLELTEKSKKYKRELHYKIEKVSDLQKDEIKILEYIIKIMCNSEILEIWKINEHIQKNSQNTAEFLELIISVRDKIEIIQNIKGNINSESKKAVKKYQKERAFNVVIISYIYIAIRMLDGFINLNWIYLIASLMIIPGINFLILGKVKNTIPYLSQKGIDESDKWEALKKYIEDYSLLKEKDEFSLSIWEEFLIYATAFGISKEVLKEIELKYKNKSSNMSYYRFSQYNEISTFKNSLDKTINSKTNSINSLGGFLSGSGFGGGFSFGGGNRRRKKSEEVEDKLDQLTKNVYNLEKKKRQK